MRVKILADHLIVSVAWLLILSGPVRFARGEDLAPVFAKTVFANCSVVGSITDFAIGELSEGEGDSLIVAGTSGYVVLNPTTGEERNTGALENTSRPGFRGMPVKILDVDGDGVFEFIRLGQAWAGNTSLHRANGKAVWAYPKSRGVNFTIPMDLNGDGKTEFLMGFNATNNVHLIDNSGALIWSQEWDTIGSIPPVFVNSKEGRSIFYVGGGDLWRRSAKGGVVARLQIPGGGFANSLELVSHIPGYSKASLMVGNYVEKAKEQFYHLYDADGDIIKRSIEQGYFERFVGAESIKVGGGKDLIVSTENVKEFDSSGGFIGRAIRIVIMDEAGRIVFQDMCSLPKGAPLAYAARLVLGGAGDCARILVGCGASVVEYSAH